MHIEFLWVIPIISLAVFFFIVAYQIQKSAERRSKTSILSKEVALFNAGQEVPKLVNIGHTDDRLQELEKAINQVAEVLSRQQMPASESGTTTTDVLADSPAANEVNELKEKLRTVFREYDIILSENYTLRAKVKQLSKQVKEPEVPTNPVEPRVDSILTGASDKPKASVSLYDDTRLINLAKMEANEYPGPSESEMS